MNIYEATGHSYIVTLHPTAGQWIPIPHSLSGNSLEFFQKLIIYKIGRCDVVGYQDQSSGDYKIFDINATGASSGITADLKYVPPPGSPLFIRLISSGDNPSGVSVPLPMSGDFYPNQTYNIQEWRPSGIGTWIQLPPITTATMVSDLASATPGVTGVLDIIWLENGDEKRWPVIDSELDLSIGYCVRTSGSVQYEQLITVSG